MDITGSLAGTVHISNIRNTHAVRIKYVNESMNVKNNYDYFVFFFIYLYRLLCGPVKGSVFIEDCSKCQIAIACQQVQLHAFIVTTCFFTDFIYSSEFIQPLTCTDFYLHVTSIRLL